jgi:hypothetical protein
MSQATSDLQSSIQVLTLTTGLYLVSVTSATPRRSGDDAELVLPAIHVGPGPGVSSQQIEMMTGPRNNGSWLCETRDMVVVRVSKGPANLLLTSLRTADMPNMDVEVRRLDAKQAGATPNLKPTGEPIGAGSSPLSPSGPSDAEASAGAPVSSRIDLHLQNRGDASFIDSLWAGELGERLAIEAFAIHALEHVRPEQTEYKAWMENGAETEWIAGGKGCGTWGQGLALTGFAVRLKGRAVAHLNCEYRGAFSSGRIVGPVKNGAPCLGADGDRLEAIQVLVGEPQRESERQHTKVSEIEPATLSRSEEARKVGPRFSVFRDAAN